MTLAEFAKKEGKSYSKAWRAYQAGEIPNAKRDDSGRIVINTITEESKPSLPLTYQIVETPAPLSVTYEEVASTRSNRAATINATDRFKHIDAGLVPFAQSNGYGNSSDISIKDAIILTQKAYFNFSIFRTTVDIMAEFCADTIYFKGGNEKSRKFFEVFWNQLNYWNLSDMWYREYFRSGNNFFYRIEGEIANEDLKKMTQVYGLDKSTNVTLPIRYVILNPADIIAGGNISFADVQYYKLLTDYELERLRSPRSEEDLQVFNSLDKETQAKIKKKGAGSVQIPLDKSKILSSFYKKQSYEAFAVPMGFPVLDDLNFKKELRNVDQAVSRTVQQAILLITMGSEPEKGGINYKNITAMQKLFENESVGRVIVADFSTKAEFLIPQIGDILDPKKYEIVDKDIAIGLGNVLLGTGEKFANQSSKVELFVKRLKNAREIFLTEFLIPEIKRIAQILGFKNYPTPVYEDIDLKNDLEYSKIYSHLIEIGVLTADEGIKAIETGRLPSPEDSLKSQEEFKASKAKGLYEPLIGGQKKEEGRPVGSTAPKTKTTVSPIGASFSLTKIKENMILASKLETSVEAALKDKHKLKKLSKDQKEISTQISNVIVANELPENWESKISQYLENPMDTNRERVNKVLEIAAEHNVDQYSASILLNSLREAPNV